MSSQLEVFLNFCSQNNKTQLPFLEAVPTVLSCLPSLVPDCLNVKKLNWISFLSLEQYCCNEIGFQMDYQWFSFLYYVCVWHLRVIFHALTLKHCTLSKIMTKHWKELLFVYILRVAKYFKRVAKSLPGFFYYLSLYRIRVAHV
jgi:hypothetical protein